jgi:hypothetical protein
VSKDLVLVVFLSACHVVFDKLLSIHFALGKLFPNLVTLLLYLVASLQCNLSELHGMIVLFECFYLLKSFLYHVTLLIIVCH